MKLIYFVVVSLLFSVKTAQCQQTQTIEGPKEYERPRDTGIATVESTRAGSASNSKIFPIHKFVESQIITSSEPRVVIDNSYGSYEVRVWDKNSVKVVADYSYDSIVSGSNHRIVAKSPVAKLTREGETVRVVTPIADATTVYPMKQTAMLPGSSYNRINKPDQEHTYRPKDMVVYVPENSVIELKGSCSVVSIPDKIHSLTGTVDNMELDAADVSVLEIQSDYSNLNFQHIDSARLIFRSGYFKAESVRSLRLNARFSFIAIKRLINAQGSSENDNIEIDSAETVDLKKQFGQLRIDVLLKSIAVDAQNCDIKVKSINARLLRAFIKSTYSTIDFPLITLPASAVKVTGSNLAIYSSIQFTITKPVQSIEKENAVNQAGNGIIRSRNNVFIEAVSDRGRADSPPIDISCSNCIINLK